LTGSSASPPRNALAEPDKSDDFRLKVLSRIIAPSAPRFFVSAAPL